MPRQVDFQEKGLLLQMFEIGEVLLQKKAVKFYSQGFCMFPCIRPGDVLHVEPRGMEQIVMGDVVVYRRYGRLYAHRVIRVGKKDGACFIVTRPDTATKDQDGFVLMEIDLLGIVVALERGGRMLGTTPCCYIGPQRVWLNIQYSTHVLQDRACTMLASMVRSSYLSGWYRFLVAMLFIHVPVSFTLVAPFGREGSDALWRKITMDGLRGGISSWRLMVKVGGELAGYVSFKLVSNKWDVDEVCLRLRYRSTSIERRMWQEVKRIRSLVEPIKA